MGTSMAIPAAVVVSVGLSEADRVIHKEPFSIKPVIGGFVLGIFLFAISELDAHLGSIFAALIVLNSAIQHNTVLGKLAKQGGKK